MLFKKDRNLEEKPSSKRLLDSTSMSETDPAVLATLPPKKKPCFFSGSDYVKVGDNGPAKAIISPK